MRPFATVLCFFAALAVAQAWPTYQTTDISTYDKGDSFGKMSISNFENSYSTKCEIEHNVPGSGYVQGQSYTLTVKTDYTGGLGLIIKAGTTKANSGGSAKAASKDVAWTATGAATMDVYAICGAKGSINKMWVAQKVTLTKAAAATTTSTTDAATTTTDAATTTTALTFDNKLSATFKISSDKTTIEFTVTLSQEAWVGIGVGDNGMSNADMVICSSGATKRYWSTAQVKPTSPGTAISGATCTQSGGKAVMKFTRDVAKSGNQNSISVTAGDKTGFVFAYGASGTTAMAYHQARGSKQFDIGAGGTATDVAGTTPNAVIWIHALCMCLAWGVLIPSGVSVAHFGRDSEKKFAGKVFWFGYHRTINATGWLLQIVGFICAFMYVGSKGGAHFAGGHTIVGLVVVILGTLQPVNAFFRPHNPPMGEEKSNARKLWEKLHIGSGYTAAIFGFVNCILGALLANMMFKSDSSLFVVALVLVGLGGLSTFYYIFNACRKDGAGGNKLENVPPN